MRLWRWAWWSGVLAPAEIAALYNGGNGDAVNPRFNFGAYESMDDNMHLWDFRRSSAGGQDFGNDSPNQTGSLLDIFTAAVNVTGADLVGDTP